MQVVRTCCATSSSSSSTTFDADVILTTSTPSALAKATPHYQILIDSSGNVLVFE